MSTFAQAFWSNDYAGGLGVLFGKLQQGVQENQQILTIARMRADAEELYAQHIGDIGPATDRITDGFQRDDGASVRKAYEGVRVEMEEAARKHSKIASNIRELVVYPFGRWCEQHASRVQNSQDDLQGRLKALDKQADWVKKLRSQYFNKCRLLEDLEEEDKLAFKEPQSESPKMAPPKVKIQEPAEDDPEPVEVGDAIYQPEQIKKILAHMLDNIKLGETKVPILGTYLNVSTGSDIVEYIQKHMNATSVAYAERIGQDMISNGFLRLVGNVGSLFTNSSRMFYQWRPKVFQLTGYPEKKKAGNLDRSSTILSMDGFDSPLVGNVGDYLANWNPLNNQYPNETSGQKLRREAKEADERYKNGVRKQDLLRCTLEEAMIEHFRFMERCELDRLKAIKAVVLDFSGAISNVIPSLQSTVDKMMLFQETVQPAGDLRYLIDNYRTGAFIPRAPIYENYYNSVDDQTFGVDIEARARADRKRVPSVVTSILMHLDNHYPLLDGDEARRAIWLVDVPLAATHRLRNEINNGKQISPELLETYEVPIVASVLKLYLLELPDSLVSSNLYEIIKAVYTTSGTAGLDSDTSSTRVSVLQNTLGQLRLANIATLDAITTHFVRLIDLTSADEQYVATLTQSLAPCILRPRNETALSLEEKYNYRFLRDLLQYKDAIFNELKRAASMTNPRVASVTAAAGGRPRTVSSTDESNRKVHMEERARAIASRSRAGSPAASHREQEGAQPSQRSLEHQQRQRRDSSRGAETRFPVHVAGTPRVNPTAQGSVAVSSPGIPHAHSNSLRQNLDVPGSVESSPVVERVEAPINGHAPEVNHPGSTETAAPTASDEAEKRNSLGRAGTPGVRYTRKPAVSTAAFSRQSGGNKRDSLVIDLPSTFSPDERRGVELTDKPMDD